MKATGNYAWDGTNDIYWVEVEDGYVPVCPKDYGCERWQALRAKEMFLTSAQEGEMKPKKEYELYGQEWETELMRWKKSELVDFIRNLLKNKNLKETRICPGCGRNVKGTCWECVGDGGLEK